MASLLAIVAFMSAISESLSAIVVFMSATVTFNSLISSANSSLTALHILGSFSCSIIRSLLAPSVLSWTSGRKKAMTGRNTLSAHSSPISMPSKTKMREQPKLLPFENLMVSRQNVQDLFVLLC